MSIFLDRIFFTCSGLRPAKLYDCLVSIGALDGRSSPVLVIEAVFSPGTGIAADWDRSVAGGDPSAEINRSVINRGFIQIS